MTVLELSLYIALAFLAQAAFFATRAFYRHWSTYQELKNRMAAPNGEEQRSASPERMTGTVTARPVEKPAWPGTRPFRVKKRVIENRNRSVCSFILEPVDDQPLPAFKPGQFLGFQLQIPGSANTASQKITRCYSLSDKPAADHYRISIKRVPPPLDNLAVAPGLSSNYFHDHIHENDIIAVKAPSGHFYLDTDNKNPIVLIGGGIGITPMLSMLNTSLEQSDQREIWLFYGVPNGADLIMGDYLRQLAQQHPNFHLHLCFSKPTTEEVYGRDYQHAGRVDIQRLRLVLPLHATQSDFYICGPRFMMETLVPALLDWGVATGQIHYEAFGPSSLPLQTRSETAVAKAVAAQKIVNIDCKASNKKLVWDGQSESLLDFVEKNGIRASSGCRAGACGACQTKVLAGTVSHTHPPDFDTEQGHCLLCVSTPATDLTLMI